MNDQGSKKIHFNKSTFFSLKAELLRKQEEVNEKKRLPQNKVENFKPSVKVKENKNENKEYKKTFKDSLKAVDTEELEACRKAKSVLEKKAKLYEHLADGVGDSQLAGRYLVDFKTKKQQNIVQEEEVDIGPPIPEQSDEQTPNMDEDEWTEFTDCLGRTRKCHKSDIDLYMKRDKELMKAIAKDVARNEDTGSTTKEDAPDPVTEKPLLVQKTNDYLQSLREKWEEKEKELLSKDRDIHYQDLLFDEARIHGVGYFSFSTDENERQKQMDELKKRREETLKAQEQAEQLRKKRDEMMAARVAAARARQRARAGLPPEEPPKENQKDFTTCLLEFLTQQRNEADAKAKEEENKLKEEKERERQKLREAYVREWDLGKEGVDEKIKKFREMTQEEYVEQQRGKRINEFAPPQTCTSSNAHIFDDTGKMLAADVSTVTKTWAEVRPKVKTPPPPVLGDLNEYKNQGLYFSTKNNNDDNRKYKNFVKAQESSPSNHENLSTNCKKGLNETYSQTSNSMTSSASVPKPFVARNEVLRTEKRKLEHCSDIESLSHSQIPKMSNKSINKPTPIVNEIDSDNESEIETSDNTRNTNQASNMVEIAPPPTFEYYGPTIKQPKYGKKPFESDIREAYAQGVKSLEAKPSNRQLSKNYDFCFE